MSNHNLKIWTAVLVVFIFVAALAFFFAFAPETVSALADGGADLMGKCIGSAAGSCDLGY